MNAVNVYSINAFANCPAGLARAFSYQIVQPGRAFRLKKLTFQYCVTLQNMPIDSRVNEYIDNYLSVFLRIGTDNITPVARSFDNIVLGVDVTVPVSIQTLNIHKQGQYIYDHLYFENLLDTDCLIQNTDPLNDYTLSVSITYEIEMI